METTTALYFTDSKEINKKEIIEVNVRLSDECRNGICDFAITGKIYNKKTKEISSCGCIHDEIAKHFPELRPFIKLHLANHYGEPMYPVENGIYHFLNSGQDVSRDYLRLTGWDWSQLNYLPYLEDKVAFKFLLFKLGVVERWKKEADEFIAFLEQKCNKKWVNPYSLEEEKFHLTLSKEEMELFEKRRVDGYYEMDNYNKRKESELRR